MQITVRVCDSVRTIKASSSDTVLQSLEKHGIEAPAHCRSGECGWCRAHLAKGEVFCPKHVEHRRAADLDYNYFHPCCSFPMSDLEIEIAPVKG